MDVVIVILIILVIFFMLHGKPLFGALGGLGLLFRIKSLIASGGSDILASDIFGQSVVSFQHPFDFLTDSTALLPIPLFTLVGYILANSKAPDRVVLMFRFVTDPVLGKLAASFGIMAIVVSAFFTPLTGASGVTIIALGGILFPILKKQQYSDKLNLGIISASGSLGLLFFPSLPIILYGIMSNNQAPIPDLFKAGIFPGILLILMPSLYVLWATRKIKPEKVEQEKVTWLHIKPILLKIILEISILPILFYAFMQGKIVIAEMGTLTLIWYFTLEIFIFKEIPFKKFYSIVEEAMSLLGGILIIIFFASGLTEFLISEGIPEMLFNMINGWVTSIAGDDINSKRLVFLVFLNIFLLMVGALMDIFSAIIVVAPLVIPIGAQFNIDMVHLGILFLTNLEIGYLTPPVGINLFISSFRFKKPLVEVYKSIIPFLFVLIFTQILITYIPFISIWFRDQPAIEGKQLNEFEYKSEDIEEDEADAATN